MKAIELLFDEALGSTVAQDQSGNGHDATLNDGEIIVTSLQGNGLLTFPYSCTEVEGNPIDFEGDFTAWMWMLSGSDIDFPHRIVVYFTFAGTTDVLQLNPNTSASSWTLLTVTKDIDVLRVYTNSVGRDSFTIPEEYGDVDCMMVVKDYYSENPPFLSQQGVYIDNFTVLNDEVYFAEDIKNLLLSQLTKMAHSLNGKDLWEDLGIRVEQSRGLVGTPAMKDPQTADWPEYHGISIDLQQVRVVERKIELDCWFIAPTRDAAIDKVAELSTEIRGSDLKRFVFQGGARVIPYDVYFPEEFNPEIPKWVEGEIVVKFTLVMVEPSPVKKVLKFVRTSDMNKTVIVNLNTNKKNFSIFWGDGTVTHNVRTPSGAPPTQVDHEYAVDGEYYITISGVVEKITNYSSNALQIWSII